MNQPQAIERALEAMRSAEQAERQIRALHTELQAELKTTSPCSDEGRILERFAMAVARSLLNITEASLCLPDEVWLARRGCGGPFGLPSHCRAPQPAAAASAVAVPA
jgi:hypothetical protein